MKVKKMKLDDLPFLTSNEKNAIRNIYNYTLQTGMFVRLYLIGSKARGDFTKESDVDIVALYREDLEFNGFSIVDYANNLNEKTGITISYMLFPEDIQYCDEEEAKNEYGGYYWIPNAIEKDGILIRMK